MITRFYVDNYKCLVNFEYKPQPMELIIGANGSGKSTVFEALDKVRQFVTGNVDARDLFTSESGTKWSSFPTQRFEIEFTEEGANRTYKYVLKINLLSYAFRVEDEVLYLEENQVIGSSWKKVNGRTYLLNEEDPFSHDDEKHADEIKFVEWTEEQVDYPFSTPNKSIVGTSFNDSYGQELSSMFFFKLNPPMMSSEIGKIAPRLNANGSNFASYYLYVLQQKQGAMFEVISHLRDVLPGFDSFAVDEDFEQGKRRLMVNFKNLDGAKTKGAAPLKFSFDDLSDGQRASIVLYTLLFCALDADATLVIDEPENYIALRELQPLIMLMEERIEEVGGQILLISHNQEFINMLTDRGKCVRFYRENNGHTRITAFNPDSSLTAAEIVARGWEDDEQ